MNYSVMFLSSLLLFLLSSLSSTEIIDNDGTTYINAERIDKVNMKLDQLNQMIMNRVNTLQSEFANLKNQQSRELSRMSTDNQQQAERLSKNIASLERAMINIKSEMTNLNMKNNDIDRQNQDSANTISKLGNFVTKNSDSISQLIKVTEKVELEIGGVIKIQSSQQANLDNIQIVIKRNLTTIDDKIANFENEIKNTRIQAQAESTDLRNNVNQNLRELGNDVLNLRRDMSSSGSQIVDTRLELLNVQNNVKDNLMNVNSDIANLRMEINSTRTEIANALVPDKDIRQELDVKNNEMRQIISEQSEVIDQIRTQNEALRRSFAVMNEKLHILMDKVNESTQSTVLN